jgi:RES domain-containing protein
MSSTIWTLDGLSSSTKPLSGKSWRAVEAQHQVSTAKLTDNLSDQHRLEQIIEASKPVVPEECRHLHFLLSTPFRYGSPYPTGSRFRRAGLTLGVFYSSELSKTAMIEMAFWRLLFFAESPDTPWPKNPGEFTTFAIEFATERALVLTAPPLVDHRDLWRHPTDYSVCQSLAEDSRRESIEILKYESARAEHAINFALLTCRAFAKNEEVGRQTWRMHLSSSGVRLFCEMPKQSIDLPRAAFAYDHRTAGMSWDR